MSYEFRVTGNKKCLISIIIVMKKEVQSYYFFLYFCGLIWKNTIETGCFREYNYTMFSTQQSINAKSP